MERQQVTKTNQGDQQRETHPSAKSALSTRTSAHPFGQLPHTMGNQAFQRLLHSGVIQAKLTVSEPGDQYEQEADRVADQVMCMSDLSEPVTGMRSMSLQVSQLQRKCMQCEEEEIQRQPIEEEKEEEEEGTLQAKEAPGQTPEVTLDVQAQINNLRGGGQPLPESVRAFFEPRFGFDFGQVRVHTDTRASESARAVNALAYTVGRDIVFNSGQYAPDSQAGRHLLTHELTHVVQQRQLPPRRTEGDPERPVSPASAGFALQQDAGNGPLTHHLLQRKDGGNSGVATTMSPSIHFELGPFELSITTHTQLAALARLLVSQMKDDLEGLPDSSPVRERANDWIAWVLWYLPYLDEHGAEPLTQDVVAKAEERMEQGGRILQDITSEKQLPVLEALRRARDEAAAAAEEFKALQPKLDDGLRAAYRTGEHSAIKEAVHMIGTSLELGHAMHELSEKIAEAFAEWKELHLPEVGKFAKGLGLLARGLAALNLAFALTEERRATELEEGMRFVGLAGETFAAGVSILGAPAHMVLYANMYVVPLTKTIITQMERLVDLLHEENVVWAQVTGNLFRPGVEPGGDKMFEFMKKVMHADTDKGVPLLTDPDIKKYLLDHREQLEAGAGEEVPTAGWFWRDIESGKAQEWMFVHRRQIWAMFYGSMAVPEQRGSKGTH